MPKRPFGGNKNDPQAAHTNSDSSAPVLSSRPTSMRSRGEVLATPSMQTRSYKQRPNWQRTQQQQFRCFYCGNWRIESFESVYLRQSSLSKYKRGLFIKTGWAQTRRQSYLAIRCAPPKKKRIWWGIVLAIVALAVLRYVPPIILGATVPSTLAAFVLLAFGVLTSGYGLVWNRAAYPKKQEAWENSFFCSRCSKATVIPPQK